MKTRGARSKRLRLLTILLPLIHLAVNMFFWSLPGEPFVFQLGFNLVYILIWIVFGIYAMKNKTP